MSKVYVTRMIPEVGINMLREKGYEVDVFAGENIPTKEEIVEALKSKEYDAVLCLLTDTIDAEVYDANKNVKIFAQYAIGYDNIDLGEAKKRGVAVTNAPGDYSYTVAERAVMLALALACRVVEADQYVRNGKYKGWDPMLFIGTSFKGKTLALIGAGKIGGHMARIMKRGFEMDVVYFDVNRNQEIEDMYGVKYFSSIEDVLKIADVVSLHLPLLDSTAHIIDAQKLKLMKKEAILINTSRGGVVDEAALVEALLNKTIAGAGLDVFEHEPVLTSGLTDLPNVILTPHIASASQGARDEMAVVAAQNIIDCLDSRKPRNLVNP